MSFSYPGRDQPVLTDINIELPAGSTVALVGENEAGKTTIVKLLTGMYRPVEGRITVDGIDLADIDTKTWRTCTTATFQTTSSSRCDLATVSELAGDLTRITDDRSVRAAVVRAGSEQDVRRDAGRSRHFGRHLHWGPRPFRRSMATHGPGFFEE